MDVELEHDPRPERLEEFRSGIASFAYSSPTHPSSTSSHPLRRSARALAAKSEAGRQDILLPASHQAKAAASSSKKASRKTSRNPGSSAKDEVLGPVNAEAKPKLAMKVKRKRGYASPETYAHLEPLPDHLKEELDIMFCGINPGVKSSQLGHHFSHRSNHFWRCLHRSGLTDRDIQLDPREDHTLPEQYNLGLTNLVDRPSAQAGELASNEFVAGVPGLLTKVARLRPRIVCFVGKGIWDTFERTIRRSIRDNPEKPSLDPPATGEGSAKPSSRSQSKGKRRNAIDKLAFSWDIQPYKVIHSEKAVAVHETLFFVLPSTSGRVVEYQLDDKVALCKLLKTRLADLKSGSLATATMSIIPISARTV